MTKVEPGDAPNKKNAVETFADMLAEVRKYGESMIIADQIPNKLTPEVLKNTNIKIVHRLFAKDDKDVIGSTMALDDDQKAFLSNLKIGHAIVFSGNWAKAMHVKVTEFKKTADERTNDEITDELRGNVLRYYLEKRSRGIFPGLDILKNNPGIDFLEKYIDTIQNEDLRGWLDSLCEKPTSSYDLDEDSPILEKLRRMVDSCGVDVASKALVVTYLPSCEEMERTIEALKQIIAVNLATDSAVEHKKVWDQVRTGSFGSY